MVSHMLPWICKTRQKLAAPDASTLTHPSSHQPVQRMLWPRVHVTLHPQQNSVWHLRPTETCLNVCSSRRGRPWVSPLALGVATSSRRPSRERHSGRIRGTKFVDLHVICALPARSANFKVSRANNKREALTTHHSFQWAPYTQDTAWSSCQPSWSSRPPRAFSSSRPPSFPSLPAPSPRQSPPSEPSPSP